VQVDGDALHDLPQVARRIPRFEANVLFRKQDEIGAPVLRDGVEPVIPGVDLGVHRETPRSPTHHIHGRGPDHAVAVVGGND
jgi:hypothetical protein